MKRILMILTTCVVTVGLLLSLTACSVDISTGNGSDPIHLEIEDIDLEQISGQLQSIDWEEISDSLQEKAGDVSQILEGISGQLQSDGESVLEGILGGLGASSGSESFRIEDYLSEDSDLLQNLYETAEDYGVELEELGENLENEFDEFGEKVESEIDSLEDELRAEEGQITLDYEEALEILREVLEENGMGNYYDLIVSQIENNPEWIKSLLESGDSGNLLQLLIGGSQNEDLPFRK